MRITSKAKGDLIFPGDELIRPGETIDVPDAHLDHPVVAGWVESGMIVIGDSEPANAVDESAPAGDPEREIKRGKRG